MFALPFAPQLFIYSTTAVFIKLKTTTVINQTNNKHEQQIV
jgi:hypothetical protein